MLKKKLINQTSLKVKNYYLQATGKTNNNNKKTSHWEKTFVKHISDKELLSKIYEVLQFNQGEKTTFKNGEKSPGQCGSVGWAASHKLKGHGFNS